MEIRRTKIMNIDLRLGDCLEVLKTIPDNSVDSVVVDPPYHLTSTKGDKKGFMGKNWDGGDIAFRTDVWSECLRVLKPGGHLLSFSSSRTYHRMAVAIEDAGFDIRDSIMWIYGSGFPKSLNIGKAIDKKQGIISHSVLELKQIIIDYFNKSGLKKNEFDKLCGFRAANYMRTESRDDDGWGEAIPSNEKWLKIKEILNIDTNEYDELFQSAIRDVIGKGSSGIGKAFTKDGWHSETMEFDITEAKNQAAKNWEGWGTALKPAHEPICMARKPLSEKSIAENVLKWGTGGINIDGCRIEGELRTTPIHSDDVKDDTTLFGLHKTIQHERVETTEGRFPANIILDEEAGKLLDEQSGTSKTRADKNYKHSKTNSDSEIFNGRGTYTPRQDEGGASRFFYCPKTSKKERNAGLEEGNKSSHPTVKPIKLMEYLITLVTPKGGVVMDCFMGSGSTGIAAKNLGFSFIGIEREQEYFDIAQQRIDYDKDNL